MSVSRMARRPLLLVLIVLMLLAAAVAILRGRAEQAADARAVAVLRAGPLDPALRGRVEFQDVPGGTIVTVNVLGLPPYLPGSGAASPVGPHGFHIHEVGNCEVGDPRNPFAAAGGHWNPDHQPHGNHAGDFPVLFSNRPAGAASMRFFTGRFRVADVVGRSVIIHLNPDDYRTQPAGNAGPRLACGVIR